MGAGAFAGAKESAAYVAELTKELRQLSDLPLGQIGDELKVILANAKQAVNELANVKTKVTAVAEGFSELGSAYSAMVVMPGALAGVDISKFTPDDAAKMRAKANQPYIDQLEKLADRVTAATKDSVLGGIFRSEISGLKAGYLTPQEALTALQGLLGPYFSGLMQEIADPKTSPAMRNLAFELERFIMSGALSP